MKGREPRPADRGGCVRKRQAPRRVPSSSLSRVLHAGELEWQTPDGRETSATIVVGWEEGVVTLMSDRAADGSVPERIRLTRPCVTPWIAVRTLAARPMPIGPIMLRLAARRRSDSEILRMVLGSVPSNN